MEQNNNREVIDNMAKQLWEMRHTDSFYGIDNYFFSSFLQSYYAQSLTTVVEWFNFLWENQKTKTETYGDIDYHIDKLHESVEKLPPSMNLEDIVTKRVMYVRNNPGGGEWIFILEKTDTTGKGSDKVFTNIKFSVDILPFSNLDVNPHIKKYAKDDCTSNFDRCCINAENMFDRRWRVERIQSNIFQFNYAAFTLGAAAKGLKNEEY
jgi:hypothetical protein